YIACHRLKTGHILNDPYHAFMFSKKSPWKVAFGTKDSIIFEDDYFVLTNMNTDPTVFYSLMRLGGFANGIYGNAADAKANPKANILFTKSCQADPRRLAAAKPIKI